MKLVVLLTWKDLKQILSSHKICNQADKLDGLFQIYTYANAGKVAKWTLHFLVGIECTTILLCEHLFYRLFMGVYTELNDCDSHGPMACDTQLTFIERPRSSMQLRDRKDDETFIMTTTNADTILGM